MTVLKANDVSITFDKQSKNPLEILKGVNLDIAQGEIVAITGKSGSGKTTLLHILSSLKKPDNGKVEIFGKDVYSLNKKELSCLRNTVIGFVFQTFNLIDSLSCVENIMLPLEIRGHVKKSEKNKLLSLAEKLSLNSNTLSKKPNVVSGGERARVAFLRSLATGAKVLFLDEPTGALDNQNAKVLEDIIVDGLKSWGVSAFLVTHDLSFAGRADRVFEIHNSVLLRKK